MRRVSRNPRLTTPKVDHLRAEEFAEIDRILKEHPEVAEWVQQDLVKAGVSLDNGRPGMTGDETLRALIIKQLNEYSYEELTFHLADSRTYRWFCGLGAFDKPWKKSCLNQNIKLVSARVLEWVNRVVLKVAREDGVENGRKSRVDCTVVETNIHEPEDSQQLSDTVRVLVRLLSTSKEKFGVAFHDRTRTAKRTAFAIRTAKQKRRRKLYRRLIKATQETIGYALQAVVALDQLVNAPGLDGLLADALRKDLMHFSVLGSKVIDQAERRVLHGETVPAQEKVFSIFEPHTDIIIKGSRDVEYGHKICLAAGTSGLITDCIILDGNPADSTLATEMMERHTIIFGRAPRQVAFDGGFSSRQNLLDIKALGGVDVVFTKHRGMTVDEMARSRRVYKGLVRFRAGVEAIISFVKRAVGLDRCLWKGHESFKAYVWASVASANLLTLARARIAKRKADAKAQAEAKAA